MSFSNLKKSTQSVSASKISVDQFIEGAIRYSNGIVEMGETSKKEPSLLKLKSLRPSMKKATFTFDERTISNLCTLSKETGICKSRILRILVQQQYIQDDNQLLIESKYT